MITESQKQALELASRGLSVSEIASDMRISARTVEHHLSESRERLAAKNTTHAVSIAIRLNVIRCVLLALCINDLSAIDTTASRNQTRVRTVSNVRIARNLQIKTGKQKA